MSTSTDVLIVGAGPVGLALAIELGQRGVRCLVVEQNDRVGYAPRAKTTNVRTREHLRRWGIADKLADASPLGVDYPSNVVFATRLDGFLLNRFENAFACAPQHDEAYSEHGQWVPQYVLEEVLRAHAASLPGVEIRFGMRLESATQDAQGVTARVVPVAGGEALTVHSAYLAGADGARSKVRELIGATMHGVGGLSRNYNVIFRAPGLAQSHRLGPAIFYWLANDEIPCIMGPMDRGDTWFFGPTMVADGVALDREQILHLIRRATGFDAAYEILSSDEWVAHRLMADRYSQGRIFLAGDACHLHPPFGGYGMNMGIGDAVDLGWKMAATLQGWGGPQLLASYEAERRPVHDFVMDEAVHNHKLLPNQLVRAGMEDDTPAGQAIREEIGAVVREAKDREFHSLGVVLGYRYDNSPIVAGDSTETPPVDTSAYVPSARPGRIAPHAWLDDGSSLYDHFGKGFTLLVLGEVDRSALDRAVQQAQQRGLPLHTFEPKSPRLRELYQAPFALIRPDQHVAWRGDALPTDFAGLLAKVAGGLNPAS